MNEELEAILNILEFTTTESIKYKVNYAPLNLAITRIEYLPVPEVTNRPSLENMLSFRNNILVSHDRDWESSVFKERMFSYYLPFKRGFKESLLKKLKELEGSEKGSVSFQELDNMLRKFERDIS